MRFGAVGALLFMAYWSYALIRSLAKDDAGGQALVAYISYPTSALVLPNLFWGLDLLGPFGAPARRIGEWALLALSGGLQYFLVGVALANLTSPSPR